jgi:ParB/RepB/Spo0J family partition protein
MNQAKITFELKKIRLGLDQILPVRQVKDPEKTVKRYATILSSVREVGIIEPLMVHPQPGQPEKYLLMDGHLRLYALKELGENAVDCIVANDDESYTFNARISRLAPIQEHKMITKAVENGVRADRIAKALNISVKEVLAALTLLEGIHEEAADLLKDKAICPKAIRVFKRVSPVRQIEIAELMVNTNNFTAGYAEALLVGTPKDQLVEQEKPKPKQMTTEVLAKMEEEMAMLERDFKAAEASYGANVLNYTVLQAFVKKLLNNTKVFRFINTRYSEILPELEKIAATEAI